MCPEYQMSDLLPPRLCKSVSFIYVLIYLWLHWVLVATRRLSLVVVSGGLLLVAVCGLLIAVASLLAERGL